MDLDPRWCRLPMPRIGQDWGLGPGGRQAVDPCAVSWTGNNRQGMDRPRPGEGMGETPCMVRRRPQTGACTKFAGAPTGSYPNPTCHASCLMPTNQCRRVRGRTWRWVAALKSARAVSRPASPQYPAALERDE
jgi:hypothetical protein